MGFEIAKSPRAAVCEGCGKAAMIIEGDFWMCLDPNCGYTEEVVIRPGDPL